MLSIESKACRWREVLLQAIAHTALAPLYPRFAGAELHYVPFPVHEMEPRDEDEANRFIDELNGWLEMNFALPNGCVLVGDPGSLVAFLDITPSARGWRQQRVFAEIQPPAEEMENEAYIKNCPVSPAERERVVRLLGRNQYTVVMGIVQGYPDGALALSVRTTVLLSPGGADARVLPATPDVELLQAVGGDLQSALRQYGMLVRSGDTGKTRITLRNSRSGN